MQHDIKFNEVETCEVHTLSNNVWVSVCLCVCKGAMHVSQSLASHEHNKLAMRCALPCYVDGVHWGRILFRRSRRFSCRFLCVFSSTCVSFLCLPLSLSVTASRGVERPQARIFHLSYMYDA